MSRLALAPRLRRLACEALRQHVFDPPSLAAIEAFTTAALWAGAGEHDARLIAATAVNMAAMLRLEQAAAEAQHWAVRRAAGEQLSPADAAALGAAEHKKRIVSAVCVRVVVCAR